METSRTNAQYKICPMNFFRTTDATDTTDTTIWKPGLTVLERKGQVLLRT